MLQWGTVEGHLLGYSSWGHSLRAVVLSVKGMTSPRVTYSQCGKNVGAGSLQLHYVSLFNKYEQYFSHNNKATLSLSACPFLNTCREAVLSWPAPHEGQQLQ